MNRHSNDILVDRGSTLTFEVLSPLYRSRPEMTYESRTGSRSISHPAFMHYLFTSPTILLVYSFISIFMSFVGDRVQSMS